MQSHFRITIPTPCHEKWEEMTPTEKGIHCKACNKVLTDFSVLTDAEIADYFLTKKEEKVCGHFRNDQLKRPVYFISPDVLLMDIPAWKKYIAILFICFSGLITGCESKQTEYVYPIPETIQHTNFQNATNNVLKNGKDTISVKKVEDYTMIVGFTIANEYKSLPILSLTELEKMLATQKK